MQKTIHVDGVLSGKLSCIDRDDDYTMPSTGGRPKGRQKTADYVGIELCTTRVSLDLINAKRALPVARQVEIDGDVVALGERIGISNAFVEIMRRELGVSDVHDQSKQKDNLL